MPKDIVCPECGSEGSMYEEVSVLYRVYDDNGTLERGSAGAKSSKEIRCDDCWADFTWEKLWNIVKEEANA